MSEQAPNLTPPAGPTPDQMDVETAFDPVAREAQVQMDIYAENRPYQDANGAVHDPANGNIVNPGEYFDEQHQIAKDHSQTAYEDMSIPALAHKLGEAEHYGDKTTEQSVTDVLLEKMGTEETRIAANQDGTETQARQDNLWDSVMAAKDLKKRQLEKQNGSLASADGGTGESGDGNGGEETQGENDDNGGAFDNAEDLEVPDEVKPFARPAFMEYGRHVEKDADGNVISDKGPKIAETYDALGDVMDWSKNKEAQRPDREMILNAEDGNGGQVKWFVKGNKIYEIDLSRSSKTSTATSEPSIKVHELQPGEDLPTMAIGQDIRDGLRLKDVLIATGEDYHHPTRTGARPKLPPTARVLYDAHGRRRLNTHSALVNPRHGKLSSDPFEHLEELTGHGNISGEPAPFNPVGGPENGPSDQENTPQINLEEGIGYFSDRFADKTYVPTLEEYAQMRELAGRIRIDYGEEDGNEPMRYLNVDGGQLNAKATRDFLDRVSPNQWQMKHRNADVAEDLYEHATPLNIRRLDLPQRTRRDWLSFRQFADARAPEQDQDGELPGEELVDQYKEYIKRRVDLNNMLTGREAAYEMYGREAKDVIAADVEAGRDVVTANDIAMDALASFRRGVNRDRQSRRSNAATRLRNARPDRLARRAARRVRGRS